MHTKLIEKYQAIFVELLAARKEADDNLPQEREAEFAAKLDDIWWKLTKDEQDGLEKEFKR
jgi:hypothetical protein